MDSKKFAAPKSESARNLSGARFEAGGETIGRTDGIRNTIEAHKIFVNAGTGESSRLKELQGQ